jgi:PAS domain S-box-containing protein
MGDSCDDRCRSADEVALLRRRVAELERANERLSEQLLAGSRQRYEDLLDSVNDIIYAADREGNLLSVNQAVERILGFTPREVIGTHYSQWISREEFARLEVFRPDTVQGVRRTSQTVIRDKQGHEHYVEISAGSFLVNGRIEGTHGVIRDVTLRHQAEQRVRESEERLRSLFNATTESIILLDRHGTMLALNETAAQRLGKSVSELIGMNMAAIGESAFPASVVNHRQSHIRQMIDTRQPGRFEDVRAGRCFDTSMYPLCDEQGNVHQIAVFAKDITERKHAEEEIRKLQQQTELVLGVTRTCLSIIDANFHMRFVDPAWQRIHGDCRGKKCYEYFHGAGHPCSGCGIPRALATKQVVVHDGFLPREGNRPNQITTIPFREESGEWLVAEVCVDIAERKLLEQKLRESEQRYRTVVESAGEAISVVDERGVFLFLNHTAGRALGGHPAEFVGKTMWAVFPAEIADRQVNTIRRVIQTRAGVNVIVPSSIQGRLRWYNTTIEPLKDSAGHVTALVIARDIHDLRTAQEEVELYREKMIRAEHLASLGTLSAMLTHEMTQPLTVIRLSIQNAMKTLEDAAGLPTVLEDLDDGLAEISHVAAIVQRFRDFARRTSDETIDSVSLSAVARRIMRLLEEGARQRRIMLDVDHLEDLPPIRTYEKDLEQVFFALAQNAIQAADGARDHIFRIQGTRREDQVELQCLDDCGGIAPQILDHLFEPFLTTKPAGEGTGLGLCVVQRIVSQAGGHLRVDSRGGDGTTFFITLPIDTEDACFPDERRPEMR